MTFDTRTPAPSPDATQALAMPAKRGSSLGALLKNPFAVFSMFYIALIVAVGILGPMIAPYGPNETNLASINAGPFTPGHILGADASGRDIFSRIIWGTQQTIIACVLVLGVSLILGLTFGLIAGFYRGRVEAIINFVSDTVMSMPGIVLLIALYALTGPNIPVAMAVFGLVVAPSFYRLVRSVVLSVRSELYVDAAKVVGLSDLRIIGRHVLSAVRAPVIVQSAFVLSTAIGILAGVDFLGLGNPSQPSWGRILQEAFKNIYTSPANIVWPSIVISVSILSFVLLGNALRDVLQASNRSASLKPALRRRLVREASDARISAMNDGDSVISIRGLRVGYPSSADEVREVVHGVDLDVRKGRIHGLVGESGSGKSQIVSSILGILPKEAVVLGGSIAFEGGDLLASPQHLKKARGRKIGYIPQEPMTNLDPSFTIGSQLMYGLRATTGMSKKEARQRLVGLLDRVGIVDPERVMGLFPHEISGGMAQRVLICGAVASDPDVIVADEPTTALDVTVQAEVLELLRELVAERQLSMVIVTHNLGVVADICDEVSVMRDGNIIEHADVETIFADPREEYTKELLASSRQVELVEAADE